MSNETIALGPGKVDLLRLVAETGSISEAARKLGMSYMRGLDFGPDYESLFYFGFDSVRAWREDRRWSASQSSGP
jgi:hypothetical protein